MTPAQRRRLRLRYAGLIDKRDFREGILWNGQWITPTEMHATASARCKWFDRQMKSVRNYINRNGKLPTGPLNHRLR